MTHLLVAIMLMTVFSMEESWMFIIRTGIWLIVFCWLVCVQWVDKLLIVYCVSVESLHKKDHIKQNIMKFLETAQNTSNWPHFDSFRANSSVSVLSFRFGQYLRSFFGFLPTSRCNFVRPKTCVGVDRKHFMSQRMTIRRESDGAEKGKLRKKSALFHFRKSKHKDKCHAANGKQLIWNIWIATLI